MDRYCISLTSASNVILSGMKIDSREIRADIRVCLREMKTLSVKRCKRLYLSDGGVLALIFPEKAAIA